MFKIPFCHLTCLGAVYFPCVQIDSFIPKNNILIYCQDTNSTMTQGGGVTPLSSRTPRAAKKNLPLVICITEMGQNFINIYS